MNYPDYEFESNDLSYMSIEEHICYHYNVGYPVSSNNELVLKIGIGQRMYISASEGSVECYSYVSELPDETYLIKLTNVVVKKRHGRV